MKWHEKAGVGLLRTEQFGIYKVRFYENRIAIQAPNLDPISWEELQRVKGEAIGEVFAVEVFPAKNADVVNLRNTRHLWFGDDISKIQDFIKHPEFE